MRTHSSARSIEQIVAALDLYRGEYLTGVSLPDAPEFDLWLLGRPHQTGGLRCSLKWHICVGHPRIPTIKSRAQILVQHLSPDLEQQMGTALGPTHLLLLDHALADHLVDRRLHKPCGDAFPVAVAVAVVGDEPLFATM